MHIKYSWLAALLISIGTAQISAGLIDGDPTGAKISYYNLDELLFDFITNPKSRNYLSKHPDFTYKIYVQDLLDNGANPHQKNDNGQTLEEIAASTADLQAIAPLLKEKPYCILL